MESQAKWPQIISHRGACGYLPEHSLEAHQLAMNLGTDYVEPDLCLTKDQQFILMHDITLDETTDIRDHPEYADRYRDGLIIFRSSLVTTLRVLCQRLYCLRIKNIKIETSSSSLFPPHLINHLQRITSRTTLYDGYFSIPTFDEYVELVKTNYDSNGGKTIGIFPELKVGVCRLLISFPHQVIFSAATFLSQLAGIREENGGHALGEPHQTWLCDP
jgi:glycerophosphoryl diester phosphodiesterase